MTTKTKLLAIDPSTRALGYALFAIRAPVGTLLVECDVILKSRVGDAHRHRGRAVLSVGGSHDWVDRIDFMVEAVSRVMRKHKVGQDPSDLVLIELPSTYNSGVGAAAAGSGAIMKLCGCVFALRAVALSAGCGCVLIPVQKWKGTLPKEITQRRVLKRWKVSGDHNMIDAVGIGDFYIREVLRLRPTFIK